MSIPLLGAISITRQRFADATVVDGIPTRPASVDTTIVASVQAAPRAVLERLANGYSSKDVIVLVTYGKLRTGQPYPDRVVYDGEVYQIEDVQKSLTFGGVQARHDVAAGVKLQAIQ